MTKKLEEEFNLPPIEDSKDEVKAELKEAIETIKTLRSELNEINLLNNKFSSFVEEVKNFPFSYEVILCDNNSNDGTTEYLRELKNKMLDNNKLKKIGAIEKPAPCIDL